MGENEQKKRRISFDKLRKINVFSSSTDGERQPLLLQGTDPPPDTLWLTYIILYIHGVGHLLPWNFFITAYDVSTVWEGMCSYGVPMEEAS